MANSSFAFWNFLVKFFYTLNPRLVDSKDVEPKDMGRGTTVPFPLLYFQPNFGIDFSYCQRVGVGQLKKMPDFFLCFNSSLRRRWLVPSRPCRIVPSSFPTTPYRNLYVP